MASLPERDWYHHAVFYEVLVRSFLDSNGDGVGDLQGLISRLDYLAWLGVDALWLPPFFQSPLRDGGYDVSDYRQVLPAFGMMDDVDQLVSEAHRRGMKVIIDLVVNHTSDQHEWFQQSRTDPEGHYGDYYVWSKTDTRWPNIRIIFTDSESSNWAFDEVRGEYYFHRFFSHQPDLNYRNPVVVAEILAIARFWLDRGVDGFRLDAVPYLFESDGGSGESEPETHQFIHQLRSMMDREYPGRILIAEANQEPIEVARYFGTADSPECHMAFDFPVMPRIFSALYSGDASSLIEVLNNSLASPATGRWAVFLRNHDELTLEMVSEQERADLYRWYAPEPRMRINVGIRRRLASLLEGSEQKLRLAHALLLSLPGTPFLYYGDEIAMGDNIWLEDRDASRTPMQWDDSKNGGFSSADSSELTLPVIDTSPWSYREVNVARALENPDSLLHFLRRSLEIRKGLLALSHQPASVLELKDRSCLVLQRGEGTGREGDVIAAFSFSPQPSEQVIGLSNAYAGASLREVFGSETTLIGQSGELEISLPAFGFGWWVVEKPGRGASAR